MNVYAIAMQKRSEFRFTKLNTLRGISDEAGGVQASLGWVFPRFVIIRYLSVQNHEVASSPFVHPQHKSGEAQSVQLGVIPQFRGEAASGSIVATLASGHEVW